METPQVKKEDGYTFGSYGFEGRFVSYFYQLQEALACKPASILEVGVGDKVFGNFIKNNTKVSYTSVDIADDLEPDVVASILELPFEDNSFDVVCAFEVLEHLPFEKFDSALRELTRVARNNVIVSLPHFGPMISFSFKVPFIKEVRYAYKLPIPKKHVFNGQHYWEIGKSNYPIGSIRKKLSFYGSLTKDFIPWGSPYHHFFILSTMLKS
jgi:SAM-dependent methyltransferase